MLRNHFRYSYAVVLFIAISVVGSFFAAPLLSAQVEQGDVNVTATVYGPPPTTQAVILLPTNGEVLPTTPLVVQGTCGPDLLVRVFNNGDLAGSIVCSLSGTFTMNITLNIGSNELTALNYDDQDQPGPNSPAVTISVVIPPVDPEDPSPPTIIIEEDTIVTDVPGADIPGVTSSEDAPRQFLFNGTFLEPITKLLALDVIVSSTMKVVFDAVLRAIFISIVFAPLLWGAFFVWINFFK